MFEVLSFSEKAHGGADFVTECVVLSRLGSDASLEVESDAISCVALGESDAISCVTLGETVCALLDLRSRAMRSVASRWARLSARELLMCSQRSNARVESVK